MKKSRYLHVGGSKKNLFRQSIVGGNLTSKSVEGTSLALQSIDHVHGCDGFPLGVFGVGDGVADDILQEDFEDTSSLFIDEAGNTFHASTASQSANGRLGNTLDIVAKHL